MQLSPDSVVYWQGGPLEVNATILFTWFNIILLTVVSGLVTRRLTTRESPSRGQSILEVIVEGIEAQIEGIGLRPARDFLPFLGSLFLFILISNLLSVVPGYQAPTGSLSTTTALALAVFVATPLWGIHRRGLAGYLKLYLEPTPLMLPFNVMGEVSRTLALAVRLFGNAMSGAMIAAILLTLVPLIFPTVMNLMGLVTGVIQAYIFAVLAAVYIAAAARVEQKREEKETSPQGGQNG